MIHLLLKNGTYIDWKSLEITETDILVTPGVTGKLEFFPHGTPDGNPQEGDPELFPGTDAPVVQEIDCTGKFITRAFANGHHHVYSALATGMPPAAKPTGNFGEILQNIWWTLDKALDPDTMRLSALVTAIACARNGVTFVIDHHASPHSIDGSLDIIAEAFGKVGIGHLLCYEISDRDGLNLAEKGLEETESYLRQHQGLVGLHASFTVGAATMNKAVRLALDHHTGIHIHAAEDLSDQEHCLNTYGIRVVERLNNEGVLAMPKTILAHCLHLNPYEREIVCRSPVWIVENMESNLNNSVGVFDPAGLGDRIMLGTDGMHSEMLRSARAAFLGGKLPMRPENETKSPDRHSQSPGFTSTRNIYHRLRNVHHYLHSAGFAGDGENNLILFDNKAPTPVTSANFTDHLLYGTLPQNISHVISNGSMIVQDHKVMTVDETLILRESRKEAARLWNRMRSCPG
ncbi:MAG TPA: amidohydrolase family protein [Bacteroidales bacterium]|nr:amidohydrolase family protein [Bacteroidales bacterium]HPS49506.1 amidohydrolase family protein [Bacteroidales bacterium]